VTDVQADALRSWAAGLDRRWQGPVLGAIAARERFDAVVASVAPGPIQDRLRELLPTIDAAVQHVADATYRAAQAQSLAGVLDAGTAADELKAARRDLDALQRGGGDTAEAQARVAALAERHRAVNRALNLAEDAASGIERWTLRLDTAVANAAAVALRASEPSAVDDLDRELREVVDGLTALDRAFDDLPS
jgi:hypothetical protein